jgi:hypothetical protein
MNIFFFPSFALKNGGSLSDRQFVSPERAINAKQEISFNPKYRRTGWNYCIGRSHIRLRRQENSIQRLSFKG